MDYLNFAILGIFWLGIIPLAMTTGAVAFVRMLFHEPVRTEGWKICICIGLLTTGTLNLTLGLAIGAGLLAVAAGWWDLSVEPSAGDYIVPIAATANAMWCAALLWRLCPASAVQRTTS